MNGRITLASLLAASIATGCATNTGIVPSGDGNYFASKQGGASMNWSGGVLKAELIKEADTFCRNNGKTLVLTSSKTIDATLYNYPSAEIHFICR